MSVLAWGCHVISALMRCWKRWHSRLSFTSSKVSTANPATPQRQQFLGSLESILITGRGSSQSMRATSIERREQRAMKNKHTVTATDDYATEIWARSHGHQRVSKRERRIVAPGSFGYQLGLAHGPHTHDSSATSVAGPALI
jgi:hypothetical protein